MNKALIIGESKMIKEALSRRVIEKYDAFIEDEVDLTDKDAVLGCVNAVKPKFLFFTGGFWFGLMENAQRPADLGFGNATIIMNVIDASFRSGVGKLLFVSSSCIYPPSAPQPLKEDSLLSAPLEPISEPSALARIWGHKLLTYFNKQYGFQFATVVPSGIFGYGDDFCPATGHVLPAFIERFTLAKEQGIKEVVLWGSGEPLREWIYVDDVADACLFAMENCENDLVNITNFEGELSIKDLAYLVAEIIGYKGKIGWDRSKPDGAYRKALDGSKLAKLGWKPKVSLRDGIERTVGWYQKNIATAK